MAIWKIAGIIALYSVAAFASPTVLDQLEASVGSSLILKSDVTKFRKNIPLRAQIDPLFSATALAQKGPKATDSEIVEYLIEDRMILSSFPTSDAETDQAIHQIQAESKLSAPALRNLLREQGYLYEDYFELIRSSVSKKMLVDAEIRTKVSVSDEDVKNYYVNRITKDSNAPKTFTFKMVTVTPSEYKTPALAKEALESARKEVLAGESIDVVARQFSPGGAPPDMAKLSEDQMTPVIRSAIKQLKIGESSPVLGSPDTFFFFVHLFDISFEDDERFVKMKEEIRGQLASVEYQRQIALWLERQKQLSYIRRATTRSE